MKKKQIKKDVRRFSKLARKRGSRRQKTYVEDKKLAPVAAHPPGVGPKKPELVVPKEAVSRARGRLTRTQQMAALERQSRANVLAGATKVFSPAPPPVGVVPEGEPTLAMDENIQASAVWAQQAIGSAFAEGVTFLGYPLLSEMAQRAEYRVISETIATEMTRKWIRFQASGETGDKSKQIKDLTTLFDDLDVKGVFRKVAEEDGFFGRGHLYVDTGDTEDRAELKTSIGDGCDAMSILKIQKGSLKAVRSVEAVWTYPTQYNTNDPLRGDWYNPQTWFVMGKEIHSSRLLRFVGREVPDLLKPTYSFGGLALSAMAKPYVDNWLRTRQSVSDLIHSFVIFILKTNLQTSVQGDGDKLFDRLDLFNLLRDNHGVMALDKDSEEFENVQASLGTLDKLQAQAQEQMAAVSRIPLVKLLGISPAGLNASSEGEIRTFYDTIHSQQEKLFKRHLTRIMHFAMLSLWGYVDKDITFVFEPLWSLDEKALADKRKVDADTDAVLIESGVIDAEESRQRVASDPETPYKSLDLTKEIVAPEDENAEEDMFGEKDGEEGDEPTKPGDKPEPGKPPAAKKAKPTSKPNVKAEPKDNPAKEFASTK